MGRGKKKAAAAEKKAMAPAEKKATATAKKKAMAPAKKKATGPVEGVFREKATEPKHKITAVKLPAEQVRTVAEILGRKPDLPDKDLAELDRMIAGVGRSFWGTVEQFESFAGRQVAAAEAATEVAASK